VAAYGRVAAPGSRSGPRRRRCPALPPLPPVVARLLAGCVAAGTGLRSRSRTPAPPTGAWPLVLVRP